MTGALFKNLVRLELLEAVRPALLVRFFEPYADYLCARNIVLDEQQVDREWVRRLHELLNSVDDEMPADLQQAIIDVADIASEQGHEQMLATLRQRQLSMFGTPTRLTAPE